MKISVVVTTYNNPEAMIRVLSGFMHQTRHPDELIVADDGSGPETAQLVFDFSKGAAFPVKHVWQEDQGFRVARIRNEAVKQAAGDYLVIMDGDCIPNKHFVADHIALSERGYFIQGKRILVDKDASRTLDREKINSSRKMLRMSLAGHLGNSHHLLHLPLLPAQRNTKLRGIKGCNMAFFKKDLLAINGYNEAFVEWGREDSEIAARLFKYGLRRKEHPFMAICFHLWHPENTRDRLSRNDELLSETLASTEYRCKYGIVK